VNGSASAFYLKERREVGIEANIHNQSKIVVLNINCIQACLSNEHFLETMSDINNYQFQTIVTEASLTKLFYCRTVIC
jgi:hypothetical protein